MSYDIEVTKIKEHTRRKSRDEENERKDITITNDMCVKNERENTLNTFILWHVINTCHNTPREKKQQVTPPKKLNAEREKKETEKEGEEKNVILKDNILFWMCERIRLLASDIAITTSLTTHFL
jgi:hypothetical protein